MSELYASMLMIGVTLSIGGLVSAAALGQFNQSAGESSLAASMQARGADTLVSLAFFAVQGSSSCPTYSGAAEGTTASIGLFDYGTQGFTPSVVALNSTTYAAPYPPVHPGSMTVLTVSLAGCAHASGQVVLVADPAGEVFQFDA